MQLSAGTKLLRKFVSFGTDKITPSEHFVMRRSRRASILWLAATIAVCLPYGVFMYKCEMEDWLLYSIGYSNNPKSHDAAYIQRILQLGANPNFTNENGVTPLMVAIAAGQPRIVEVLLQHGADPNWPSKTGNAMLWARVRANSDPAVKPIVPRMIAMLKAAGAKEWQQPLSVGNR